MSTAERGPTGTATAATFLYVAGRPVTLREFAAASWGRNVVHGRLDEAFVNAVKSSPEVEDLLAQDLIYDTRTSHLLSRQTKRNMPPRGIADVLEGIRNGQSVVVKHLERLLTRGHPLRKLVDAVEDDTNHSLYSVTMMISPALAEIFEPHSDNEHIITLQVMGRKRWKIFAGKSQSDLGEETVHELGPGDFFYVPPNVSHHVESLDEISVSYALIFHPVHKNALWEFLVRDISFDASRQRSAALSGAVPYPVTRADQEELATLMEPFLQKVREKAASATAADLAAHIIDRASRSRKPRSDFEWKQIEPCEEPADRYRLNGGVHWKLTEAAHGLGIYLGNGLTFKAPAKIKAELCWILAQAEEFAAQDIPTRYSPESILKLLNRLQEAGILRRR